MGLAGPLPYEERHDALKRLCVKLARAWADFEVGGHPIEVGESFQTRRCLACWSELNAGRGPEAEQMPWLAALVACSAFDVALHDAYGILHGRPIYETYDDRFMNADLSAYLKPRGGPASRSWADIPPTTSSRNRRRNCPRGTSWGARTRSTPPS